MEDYNNPSTTGGTTTEPGQADRGAKEELRATAQSAAGALREEYGALREDARQEIESAKRQARDLADSQRRAAEEDIGAVAEALRSSAQSLEEQGKARAASYTRHAAAGIDSAAQWLHGKSFGDVWREAERYAREQPAVAFGGALAAGFLLARFLKSSAPHEPASSASSEGWNEQRPGGY